MTLLMRLWRLLLLVCLLALVAKAQPDSTWSDGSKTMDASLVHGQDQTWFEAIKSPLTGFCLPCFLETHRTFILIMTAGAIVVSVGYKLFFKQPELGAFYVAKSIGLTGRHEAAAVAFKTLAEKSVKANKHDVAVYAYSNAGQEFTADNMHVMAGMMYERLAAQHHLLGNKEAEAKAYDQSGDAYLQTDMKLRAAARLCTAADLYLSLCKYRAARLTYIASASTFEAAGRLKKGAEIRQIIANI